MNEKYDLICVFKPNTPEERMDAVLSKIDKKLKSLGGEILRTMKIGIRRVHTRMRKFKTIHDGFFVECEISSPAKGPFEVESILHVTEELMRHILTKAKVVPVPVQEKPSEEKVEINPEMLIGKPE
jgi:ribosomal protein S6